MTSRALVIARHRQQVVIETGGGETLNALPGSRRMRPLTGDEVTWRREADGTAVIGEILPRRSVLERIDNRGRAEGVAANVSLIVVVIAPTPAPDWQLVDRYLAAAELMSIDAALVRNKQDIADRTLDERLSCYRDIGYGVIMAGARTGKGIDELAERLHDQRAVLVGQSGVGKSSLLNALLDEEAQAVGRLSQRRALGRHTTTAAMLHRLPRGGELIDSPGVRRYAPSVSDPADLARGFVEFAPLLGRCRFNDCSHVDEPGCAVRAAVDEGRIDAERYASYVGLRANMRPLR